MTRGSAGAHLSWEVKSRAVGDVESAEAHLNWEIRSEVVGHVAAPESTSAGR
jgi:hypothetical protein